MTSGPHAPLLCTICNLNKVHTESTSRRKTENNENAASHCFPGSVVLSVPYEMAHMNIIWSLVNELRPFYTCACASVYI